MDIAVLAFRHFAREIRQTPWLKSVLDIRLIEPDSFDTARAVGDETLGNVEIPPVPGAASSISSTWPRIVAS